MKNLIILCSVSLLIIACNDGNANTDITETESVNIGSGLPYIGFHDYGNTIKNGEEVVDTIYHTIPEFYLTAQDSSTFSNKNVEGRIHVANFFFTSCPAICPAMIAQMKRLQEKTNDIDELMFVSHTIDPRRDSIPRLNEYIAQKELDTHNWFFLYGEKQYVHDLGTDGYMVNAMEDEKADGGFLHSEHFVLVDREGHVRGLYTGTETDEVDKLEQDIRKLLKTEYGK